MELLLFADATMVAVATGLLVLLIAARARSRRRRARAEAARARFEDLLAEQLVSPEPIAPPHELDAFNRDVLLEVASSALLELRGGERDELALLLERAGLVEAQADALRRGRPATRRLAADLLGLIASPATRAPLRVALGDGDELVRLSAARGLAELGDEDLGPVAAIADAAVERHGGSVAELVVTLGARRPAALRDLYNNARALELRRPVVAAIGELRLTRHADLLREALDAADSELVARAARALGLLGDVEATDRLVGLAREPAQPWYVRSVASTALGQLGDPAAVPALAAELVQGAEWPERRAAAEALARLGPDGEQALERALAAAGDGVREHARAALDRW